MPGKVVKVQRRERLGWAQRLYLPMIFVGLQVTTRHFMRNFIGYLRGEKRTFVVQYPEERVDYPDAFRGHPVLVALENGEPKCVACGLCEEACPEEAIVMSRTVELGTYDRSSMLLNKKDLLRTEEQLDRRLGYIRDGYDR